TRGPTHGYGMLAALMKQLDKLKDHLTHSVTGKKLEAEIAAATRMPALGNAYLTIHRLRDSGLLHEDPNVAAKPHKQRGPTYRLSGKGKDVLELDVARMRWLVALADGNGAADQVEQ